MAMSEREMGMIIEALDQLKRGQGELFAVVNSIRASGCAKAPEHESLSARIYKNDERIRALENDRQKVVGAIATVGVLGGTIGAFLMWVGKLILGKGNV